MSDPGTTKATTTTVLVIEDDDSYRELLVSALTLYGYAADAAENGAKAKRLCAGSPPDLIIVDLRMPIMDGLRFLRWLRTESKSETPVIVLTCLDNKAASVEALVAGANDVLIKPVDLDTLLGRVRNHVASGKSSSGFLPMDSNALKKEESSR